MEIPLSDESLPATPRLRKGDVVRVTRANRMQRYEPGDKGTIVLGPKGLGSGQLYYLVMMDKDEPLRIVIFTDDEIESDRWGRRPARRGDLNPSCRDSCRARACKGCYKERPKADLQLSGWERVAVGEVADLLLASELLADRPACYDGAHIADALRDWYADERGESLAERVAHLDHFEGLDLLRRCKGVWLDWRVDTDPDASCLLARMKAGDLEAARFYFAMLRVHPDPEARAVLERFTDIVKEVDGVDSELKADFLRLMGHQGPAEGQEGGREPRVETR